MKYVHVFTHAEVEADEGTLHWPWVAPDRLELRDRVARARTSAREEVAARIAGATSPSSSSDEVRRRRRRAADAARRAARAQVSESEASTDA